MLMLSFACSDVAPSGLCGNRDDVEEPVAAVDLPIDPLEPTYCLCQQVAFGSMIACDNPQVRCEVAATPRHALERRITIVVAVDRSRARCADDVQL